MVFWIFFTPTCNYIRINVLFSLSFNLIIAETHTATTVNYKLKTGSDLDNIEIEIPD